MVKFLNFICLLGFLCFQSCNQTTSNVAPDQTKQGLVWSDEFDVDGLPNPNNWKYDEGDGCPQVCGWGNNELQFYTKAISENARVENGKLIIEAHKANRSNSTYTSARLLTAGKQDWKYGTIEVKAKLPSGKGTWPAIWMLPTQKEYGGWPKSGEIDIMEHVGYNPDSIFGTVHTSAFNHLLGTQDDGSLYQNTAEGNWHTYKIKWTDKEITWFVDDISYHNFKNKEKTFKEWPFDKEFHLILNLAVGGNWGGKHGVDENIWPQRMEVDWVRVYQ